MRVDVDVCVCGDLRREHSDEIGPCLECDDCFGFEYDFANDMNETIDEMLDDDAR